MILEHDVVASPVGHLELFARGRALCALGFADGRGDMRAWLQRRFGAIDVRPTKDPAGLVSALNAYFYGDTAVIDTLCVDTGGTAFQMKVWTALRAIPVGQTISYAELARRVGSPKAVRAVGLANGQNPVSIVVPCHRVIGSNGRLTGYGGGLHRKEWLLRHEGVSN